MKGLTCWLSLSLAVSAVGCSKDEPKLAAVEPAAVEPAAPEPPGLRVTVDQARIGVTYVPAYTDDAAKAKAPDEARTHPNLVQLEADGSVGKRWLQGQNPDSFMIDAVYAVLAPLSKRTRELAATGVAKLPERLEFEIEQTIPYRTLVQLFHSASSAGFDKLSVTVDNVKLAMRMGKIRRNSPTVMLNWADNGVHAQLWGTDSERQPLSVGGACPPFPTGASTAVLAQHLANLADHDVHVGFSPPLSIDWQTVAKGLRPFANQKRPLTAAIGGGGPPSCDDALPLASLGTFLNEQTDDLELDPPARKKTFLKVLGTSAPPGQPNKPSEAKTIDRLKDSAVTPRDANPSP